MPTPLDMRGLRHETWLHMADGRAVLLTPFITGRNREELQGQWPQRMTLKLRDDDIPGVGALAEAAALGNKLVNLSSTDGGSTWTETFRGTIEAWDPGDNDDLDVTASDDLATLQFDDQRRYPAGMKGSDILADLFQSWGVPVWDIAGPDAALPEINFSGKVGDLAMQVLQHGLALGNKAYLLRMREGKAEVVAPGANDPVYGFDARTSVLKATEKLSLDGVYNEVLIIGNESQDSDPNKRAPIETQLITSADDQKLGGRRRLVLRSSAYDSPAAALDAAKTELEKGRDPKREREVTLLDAPLVRKGDVIKVRARTLDGYYSVFEVSHDEDAQTMHCKLGERGSPLYEAKRFEEQKEVLASDSGGAGGKAATGGKVGSLLAYCRAHLGTPYVWNGGHPSTYFPGGWDCSGFVNIAFHSVGIPMEGNTDSQPYNGLMVPVPFAQRRPGDLVYYSKINTIYGLSGHVAIVAENVNMVYSASGPSTVYTGINIRTIVGVYRVKALAG